MKTLSLVILALVSLLPSVGAQEVRSGQALKISINGVPVSEKGRLDNIYSVSESGFIEMWMIGSVKAVGLTKTELAKVIARKYQQAEIYTSPVFQIFSENDEIAQDNQIVTVGGQVNRPGQQQWTKGLTLYAAIQSAGGESPFGAMNRVRLYRPGEQVREFDMGRKESKAFKVQPFDTVEVPQKKFYE